MMYCNQLYLGTTYNYDEEYRPKLYKRVRTFQWIDPVHETVNLEPVIFDSEVRIIHMPTECHGKRDFHTFQAVLKRGEVLSKKLHNMYARELFIVGEDEDFLEAMPYFESSIQKEGATEEEILDAICVLARCYRLTNNLKDLFKVCIKGVAGQASSELCYELGMYFYEIEDFSEAILWLENAAFETESRLNIQYQKEKPVEMLVKISSQCGAMEQAELYKQYL